MHMISQKRVWKCMAACAFSLLLVLSSTGCTDKNEVDSTMSDVEMGDLAYGATMRDDDSHAIPLEYDKRYFTEAAELDAVVNYYTAILTQDVELLQSCTVREYMNYLYDNVYGGLLDDSAFLAQQQEKLSEEIGGEYTISQIQITDCLEAEDAGSEAQRLTDMLNSLKGDENYCANHMQSCKTLTLTLLLSSTDETAESVLCEDIPVYLLCLDDAYYVCV